MNHTAYLLTGSNMGDRKANLEKAKRLIDERAGQVRAASGLYETEAWGNTDQEPFYNQALEINTPLGPRELLRELLHIEEMLGRTRDGQRWQPRVIDIDILLYDAAVVQEPDLRIPHPELSNRNFALVPLMEIAPEVIHPELQVPVDELYFNSRDESEVVSLEA